jgi:hypothetical protein
MRVALKAFDAALPDLKTMRNVAEHIDDYAVDEGRDTKISRKQLEVSSNEDEKWCWLGFEMNVHEALLASVRLFEAMKACAPSVAERPKIEPKPTPIVPLSLVSLKAKHPV